MRTSIFFKDNSENEQHLRFELQINSSCGDVCGKWGTSHITFEGIRVRNYCEPTLKHNL